MTTPLENPLAQKVPEEPARPHIPAAVQATFRETEPLHEKGLVGHVWIVAMLMIVQGFLEILFGIGMLFMALFFTMIRMPEMDNREAFMVFCYVLAVPGIICGALHVVAGMMNYLFRGRALGMVAMGLGLLTFFTAYCAPTAIAIAIYGIVVYLNESVIHAFELRKQGRSREEVLAAFAPR